MDIIKLYGRGIENFVPNHEYNHNVYGVANEIINNHEVEIKTTLVQDDICKPCKYIGKDGACVDCIGHIKGITSKNEWNRIIDNRIVEYANVLKDDIYSAHQYCEILYSIREYIFDIWKEESNAMKEERYNSFCNGAKKYLGLI